MPSNLSSLKYIKKLLLLDISTVYVSNVYTKFTLVPNVFLRSIISYIFYFF